MKEKLMGGRVRRLRERKAWTQEHLADAAQVSARTIQRAEEGVMSAETLSAIAGALDVAVDAISGPSKTPDQAPRITPALFYADPNAAYEWLQHAFGFEPRMSVPGPDGKLVHAELDFDGGRIMLGQDVAASKWRSPQSLDGEVTMSLFIYVDDVDLHCDNARAAGAAIRVEPEDMHGMRRYLAADPEGHHFWFAAPVES